MHIRLARREPWGERERKEMATIVDDPFG